MCGIAGLWKRSDGGTGGVENTAALMAAALRLRGPDDAGVWSDAAVGVALAHQRLSILDLSAAGHQPMISASQRFVLSYNGELYNYLELRKELEREGVRFRSDCDTEVLLEALATWGVREALARFNGMFAFALWDRKEQQLFLARDPFGIKPLYVGWIDGAMVFGSEVKVLRAVPGAALSVDRTALVEYLRYGFVPAPLSIFSHVFKVMPGTAVCVSLPERALPAGFSKRSPFEFSGMQIGVHEYWSLAQDYARGKASPLELSFEEAVEELETILSRAVKRQRAADVPVGAFLSSGIDSSTIVALLKKDAAPLRTYTIGVHDARLNEAAGAKAIAARLGTQHTELILSEAEVLEAIAGLTAVYDEPFADSSQIATWLVARLAKSDVKVVLTGDGGDELFAGYNRHVHGISLWQTLRKIPPGAREGLVEMASSEMLALLDGVLGSAVGRVFPGLQQRSFSNLREKVASLADADSMEELYRNLVSLTREPARFVDGIDAAPAFDSAHGLDGLRQMMALDGTHYLPNDILTKVDRATMAFSIEARVPFLDREAAAFAARLPDEFLIQKNAGKRILRSVLKKYVPAALVDQPKRGFAVPIGEWLRGPLQSSSREAVREAARRHAGLLRWDLIGAEMDAFFDGRRERAEWIWGVVRLANWLNRS